MPGKLSPDFVSRSMSNKAKHGYLPRSALEPFEPVRMKFRRPKLPYGWVWDLFLLSFRTFLLTRNLYVTETLFYIPASDVLHLQTLVHAHTCTDTHTHAHARAHTHTHTHARAHTHTHTHTQHSPDDHENSCEYNSSYVLLAAKPR